MQSEPKPYWHFWVLISTFSIVLLYLSCEALVPRRPIDKGVFEVTLSLLAIIITAVAVVAALWTSYRSEQRANEEALALARIAAARHCDTLKGIALDLSSVSARFDFAESRTDFMGAINALATLTGPEYVFSDESLRALAPIGGHCASQIAHATSKLQRLQGKVYQDSSFLREHPELSDTLIREKARKRGRELDDVRDMLSSAAAKCERAAGVHELVPEPDE